MDAHLFRVFAGNVSGLLEGSRLSKVQEPAPGVLTFNFDMFRRDCAFGRKAQLVFRPGRNSPFLFLSRSRMAAGKSPSAPVMRLRKYAAGRSVRHVLARWVERELWLLMSGSMGDAPESASSAPSGEAQKLVWLVLDLREGAKIRFLSPEEAPSPSEARWPEYGEFEGAMQGWREWPVLTPALRRTLVKMDGPDARALLCDLEEGGGDIFLYERDGEGGAAHVEKISCWPLAELPEGLRETVCEEPLEAFERAGADLVLAEAAKRQAVAAVQPLRRRQKRLQALLEKQDEDEARLKRMLEGRGRALLLQANLWRWPASHKAAAVEFEDAGGAPCRIALDPKLNVRENMARLFHQAKRGERGFEHVARRRKELESELADLARREESVLLGGAGVQTQAEPADSKSGALPELPKRVQMFVSSDGFVLLRGRDAKGNQDVRRMSSPHDIWVHAQGGPGSHVIIRRSHAGVVVPDRTLDEAGGLAACRSWLREEPSARLTYCELRHVKPLRGAAPGTMRMDKVLCTRVVAVDFGLEERLAPKIGEAAKQPSL